jgi:hypothetical protein
MMQRACELREAEWPVRRVSELLAREFSVRAPHATTIRRWTEPGFAEQQNREGKERGVLKWLQNNPPRPHKVSALRATVLMVKMRERGLSWRAITIVAELWWASTLTQDQVQDRVEVAMQETEAPA